MSARCTASRPWTPASANPARTRISYLQCTKRADPSVKRTPASFVAGLVLRALMPASERRFTPSGSSNLSQVQEGGAKRRRPGASWLVFRASRLRCGDGATAYASTCSQCIVEGALALHASSVRSGPIAAITVGARRRRITAPPTAASAIATATPGSDAATFADTNHPASPPWSRPRPQY